MGLPEQGMIASLAYPNRSSCKKNDRIHSKLRGYTHFLALNPNKLVSKCKKTNKEVTCRFFQKELFFPLFQVRAVF